MNNEWQSEISDFSENSIAIIGMAGRFPGAKNLREFWDGLLCGKETISYFSDDQLRKAGVDASLLHNPSYVKAAGILDDIEQFDADFFGMTPYEASITDPQQRLLLEVCWEALEVSGYIHRKKDVSIGVFAGMSDSTYLPNCLLRNEVFLKSHYPYQTHVATSGNFLATKISYYLNLTGPSITINTACSTSLVTVTMACQALLAGECDMALAGGASLRVPQIQGYLYQEGGILSKDGKCRAFDKQASGTVSSSGVGVVVLKRLADALRDGDSIDAVIKGYGINNDGSEKIGYTAPSLLEQSRCIANALADMDVESIGYVEAHGTGTVLGDPIEISALTKAFRHYTSKKNYCAIGSVKTNIGHANTAAGIAGLIKTVLVLKNGMIPATLHFQEANSHIDFLDSPFYVNNIGIPWEKNLLPRRAGVSSFGIGGTNAHVVLEEAPPFQNKEMGEKRKHHILLLSAKSKAALKVMISNLCQHLKAVHEGDHEILANAAFTLQLGRRHFSERYAIVCETVKAARTQLEMHSGFFASLDEKKSSPPKNVEFKSLFKDSLDASHALAQLWLGGADIDWVAYHGDASCRRIPLPTYPFEGRRHWIDPLVPVKEKIITENKPALYQAYWEVSSLDEKNTLNMSENWLIFMDTLGVSENLIRHLQSLKQNVIVVCSGDALDKKNEHFYTINFSSQKDYIKLFEFLEKENNLPVYIVHAFSLSELSINRQHLLSSENSMHYFLSFIYTAKTFFNSERSKNSSILIVSNYSQKIFHDDPLMPVKSYIQGPLLVIPQEYSQVSCRMVDISDADLNNKKALSKKLLQEMFSNVKHNIVAYRNDRRFIKQYKRFSDFNKKGASELKEKGVYLIVGAFGNIGMYLVAYLADAFSAHLILVSRTFAYPEVSFEYNGSPTEKERKNHLVAKLKIIEKKASSLKVVQADAGNQEQMMALFRDIEKTHTCLDGVFYLAAVAQLASTKVFIKDIKSEQVAEQFAPKIHAIEVLQEVMDHFQVNFCCLYSSLSTVIGGVGLTSYVTSNAYLDALVALHQRNAKTRWIGINWDAIQSSNGSNLRQASERGGELQRLQKKEMDYFLDSIFKNLQDTSSFIVSTKNLQDRIDKWINPIEKSEKNNGSKGSLFIENSSQNIEGLLIKIFESSLGVQGVDKQDNFYDLGGDSLMALHLLETIEKTFHVRISLNQLIERNTVQSLAPLIEKYEEKTSNSCIIKLNKRNNKNPVFLIHPVGGAVFCYLDLAKYLSAELYGIQDPNMNSMDFNRCRFNTLADMAKEYLAHILKIQPEGEYCIGGFSFGGSVAFEVARQLENRGKKVKIIFIIDAWASFSPDLKNYDTFCQSTQYILEEINQKMVDLPMSRKKFLDLAWHRMNILFDYCPSNTAIPMVLFKAKEILEEYKAVDEETNHWRHYTSNLIAVYTIEGNHQTILKALSAKKIAALMSEYIN